MSTNFRRFLFASISLGLLLGTVFGDVATAQQQGKGAQAVLARGQQLDLTTEQSTEIRGILQETAAEFNKVSSANRGDAGLAEKLDSIRQQGQQKALKVLTSQQRKIWDNMAPVSGGGANTQPAGAEEMAARSLIIPSIEEMKNPPSRGAFGPSAEITETTAHPPLGDAYVIVTDYDDPGASKALERLAEHRGGTILRIPSLGKLHESSAQCVDLRDQLRKLKPRYVAVAPRMESYRENLHLCLLKLLTSLDDDPELDAFPGYLMAPDSDSLVELINRTISFQSITPATLKPASIGTIEDNDARRYRSYQKAMVIQKMFTEKNVESPAIIITTRRSHTQRDDFPELEDRRDAVTMLPKSERHTFDSLSDDAIDTLAQNNLLYMFGHGTTEQICGTEISAFADIDFSNEIVFCGSCMSATPMDSDRPSPRPPRDEKRFASQAIENGAVMLLGHMGLCGGFPKVYPMSELVLQGLSAGESYQRLMNALIGNRPIPDYYSGQQSGPDAANGLLYILWGDPALVPIAP